MSSTNEHEAKAKRVWLRAYAYPAVKAKKMRDREFAAAVYRKDAVGALQRLQQIRDDHLKSRSVTPDAKSRPDRMCAFRARILLGKYEGLADPVRQELARLQPQSHRSPDGVVRAG